MNESLRNSMMSALRALLPMVTAAAGAAVIWAVRSLLGADAAADPSVVSAAQGFGAAVGAVAGVVISGVFGARAKAQARSDGRAEVLYNISRGGTG